MAETVLPLPISSYRLPTPQAAAPRLINAYAEVQYKQSAKGPFLLRRAPGIASWVTVGDGPIRGAKMHDGLLYVLSGTSVYTVDSGGTVSSAFTGSVPGGERVVMETNGTNLVIVRPATGLAYYNSAATTISQITDSTFTGWGAIDVAFVDGYLNFLAPDSQLMFNSGVNALTFNALDFTTIDGAPDLTIGMVADHRELFLPGVDTCEIWYNAQNPTGSPFSRSPNGLLEVGSAAAYSYAKQDNSVFWLADDLTVRRLSGPNSPRVSQHGIETAFNSFAQVSDAFGLAYEQAGHLFYVLQFPNAGRSFVYDPGIREWHERESLGYGMWRPNVILKAYGMQVVGDSQSGRVGFLDPNTHEEWGEPQRVEVTLGSAYNMGNRITHHRLDLMVNTGDGLTVGQGSNPLATLKISNNGGRTFRSLPTKSLGIQGNYDARLYWTKLGTCRDRVYQLEMSDPIPFFFMNAVLTYSPAAR